MIVHVDNMFVLGSQYGINELKSILDAIFEMKWLVAV